MSLPFFYTREHIDSTGTIVLDEENSRHAVQVLRMTAGSRLRLTDGRGLLLTGEISEAHKKHCTIRVLSAEQVLAPARKITLAISPLKNPSRLEWFLEKATELGVVEIVLLRCARTEKDKVRTDRLQAICISALLQSQQAWLPRLEEPVAFPDYILSCRQPVRLIAHCEPGEKAAITRLPGFPFSEAVLLIGPEGDFTPDEIRLALEHGFQPVSLGATRLRTETAGVAGAVLLTNG